MGRALRQQSELLAGFLAHPDASLAALIDQALEPLVVALAGNQNVVKAPPARPEGFFDRVQAIKNFHKE
jgi:hypothetical protein